MTYLILFFVFLFGLIIGSFLNCLIWRLHTGEGMLNRSYCPKCRKQIAWYNNIPLLSFIFLAGKCRQCKKKISWQYPVVELVIGILFVLSFCLNLEFFATNDFPNFQFSIFNFQSLFTFNFLLLTFRDWFIISVMTIIFIYDLRWYLILDIVTLPAILVVLILNLILGFGWLNLLLAGAIGGGFFLLQFVVSQGKWIGGGDIRLGLLMGITLGRIDYLITAMMLAYFMGSIIGIGLISAKKKQWGSKLPLGVFLSLATIITMFAGEKIINWYFGLF